MAMRLLFNQWTIFRNKCIYIYRTHYTSICSEIHFEFPLLFSSFINLKQKIIETKNLPVTEFIWKLVLLGNKLYRSTAFTSRSASVAFTAPIIIPRREFSSTLNSYESLVNCGSLSFASSMLTMTCAVAVADGVPLSLANTVISYRSCVSRSNAARKYIQPLFGNIPKTSDASSELLVPFAVWFCWCCW